MTEPALQVSGVRALAVLLGTNKTKAAELAKEPWFPPRGPDGSWSTVAVKKAYEDFVAGRLGAPSAPEAPRTAENLDDEQKLKDVLSTSTNPEEVANATMQLVARSIARSDVLGVKHVIAMKAALEELRKGAAGYLKLSQEKGDLIARDVAKVVIGQLARRAIAVLERYEVELAQRVEAWFGDAVFRAATSEERTRAVREWARSKTEDLRALEAKQIEDLVAAEVKEQATA